MGFYSFPQLGAALLQMHALSVVVLVNRSNVYLHPNPALPLLAHTTQSLQIESAGWHRPGPVICERNIRNPAKSFGTNVNRTLMPTLAHAQCWDAQPILKHFGPKSRFLCGDDAKSQYLTRRYRPRARYAHMLASVGTNISILPGYRAHG
jgi:hypothetical protein